METIIITSANNHPEAEEYSLLDAVITKEDEIYCSLCLELNVASEGETLEESKKNLLRVVKDYLELAIENNLPIIRNVPWEDNPLVNGEEIIDKFKIQTNVNIVEYA